VTPGHLLTLCSPLASNKYPGISFWYETSLNSSFVPSEAANGKTLSVWLDLSTVTPNLQHNAFAGQRSNPSLFTYNPQAYPTFGPKFLENGINGLPTVRITNDQTRNEFMVVSPNFQSMDTGGHNIFLFVVFRLVAGFPGFVIDRSLIRERPLFGFYVDQNRDILFNARDNNGNNAGSNFMFSTGASLQLNTPYVLTLQRIFRQRFSARLNGQPLPGIANDVIGDITMDPLKFGRHANGYQEGTADFSEMVLILSPLSVSDVLSIETYLGQKYNVYIEMAACNPGMFLNVSNKQQKVAACSICSPGTYSSQQGMHTCKN
jgi:hypothetical protein